MLIEVGSTKYKVKKLRKANRYIRIRIKKTNNDQPSTTLKERIYKLRIQES